MCVPDLPCYRNVDADVAQQTQYEHTVSMIPTQAPRPETRPTFCIYEHYIDLHKTRHTSSTHTCGLWCLRFVVVFASPTVQTARLHGGSSMPGFGALQ